MNEEFLHYIWKLSLFNPGLILTDGSRISVIDTGVYNEHAGPDFFNGQIRMMDAIWAGNIEIHVNASDWFRHMHQNDPAYDNIILHIVYKADAEVRRKDNSLIPCLEIKGQFDENIFKRYQHMINRRSDIACEEFFPVVEPLNLKSWLDRLAVERLERRTDHIQRLLKQSKYNWGKVFYILVFSAFGFKINALPFELLAKSIPYQVMLKNNDELFRLEALLFGQAGYLNDSLQDVYLNELSAEYSHLKNKYDLIPIEKHLWKFLRLRPSNFPTIRLAQLAAFIFNIKDIHVLTESNAYDKLLKTVLQIDVSDYWQEHYIPDKTSKTCSKKLSIQTINSLFINTVIPFIFSKGIIQNNSSLINDSLDMLAKIKAEQNHIISIYEKLGLKPENSLESQAMLELHNNFCKYKKCLDCAIGNIILKKKFK